MAYVNANYVETMQRNHNALFWKVQDRAKKLTINKQTKNIDIDESVELLQETLANCSGDYVLVTLYTEKPEQLQSGSTKGQSFDLMVKLNDVQNFRQTHNISGTPTFSDLMNMQNKIHQMEMEKQRKEIEDSISAPPHPATALVNKLIEGENLNLLIGAVMNKIFKTSTLVPTVNGTQSSNDLNETLSKLQKIDSDYLKTLSDMATYLEKNPAVLNQIKMIINS